MLNALTPISTKLSNTPIHFWAVVIPAPPLDYLIYNNSFFGHIGKGMFIYKFFSLICIKQEN
ncbi:hypothetical protein C1G86_1176 [Dehalococcoides mccartyi]|uniref:Uncharacterized protein n=1 Tax=Dehalococcoides mccartyi TaxID=61435 RepID=A0A328EQS6_9CHLR|nr:hypothetical protein C1G86_1176 [Dehalococcoides mccartyi]